jgi:hypothetical protein
MEDFPAKEEASSLPKTFSPSKHEISEFSSSVADPDPVSGIRDWVPF